MTFPESLEILYCDNNNLHEFDRSIGDCNNLRYVSCSGNPVQDKINRYFERFPFDEEDKFKIFLTTFLKDRDVQSWNPISPYSREKRKFVEDIYLDESEEEDTTSTTENKKRKLVDYSSDENDEKINENNDKKKDSDSSSSES